MTILRAILGLILFANQTLANICDISFILQVNVIKTINKKCSDISINQLEKIKKLDLSTSSAAEKCNRPEVIYKKDLELFKSIQELNISRNLLTQAEAQLYLKSHDSGIMNNQTPKTDGRFGPCVMYSDQDRMTWDLMWSVIDKKTSANIPDIAESFYSVISYFPNVKTLKAHPFQINEPLEPIIKNLKLLENLDACPNSSDSHSTVFNQIQNLKKLKLEACFLVSKFPHPPPLGKSMSLTHFTIKENQWTFLDAKYFLNTPNIEHLDLSRNNFKTLPVGLFSNLSKLKKVNLKGHQFSKSEKQRIQNELQAASPQLTKPKSILL